MNKGIFKEEENLFTISFDENNQKKSNVIKRKDLILEKLKNSEIKPDCKFSLKTESYLLQLAYSYNKILSLSNSRTRILAHQVESTHKIVGALKQRFLLADEVGLGKTIEAGLVIKEMIYRKNYKRIIIIAPASLLFQWQQEMHSKFNEEFVIMDRAKLIAAQKQVGKKGNPWNLHDKIICSLDFIKNDLYAEDLKSTKWDTVVFDEAHRLRRDSKHSTLGYNVAEIISPNTESLLLLSATPFRGKLEELYFLIALLDKNTLGPFQSFYNDYCLENSDLSGLKDKISTVVIRRTKKEIGGFTKRHARTIKFEFYPDERLLYEETTRYVIEEFNRAQQVENRAVGFVMTVFQKLLDSSSYALLSALKNRFNKLSLLLERAEKNNEAIVQENLNFDLDEFIDEDISEELADFSIEKSIEELRLEINTLEKLISIAGNIKLNKKGENLIELVGKLRERGHKKFLIFTQFRTTQIYLENILSDYNVAVFHGSMNRDEKEEAIERFKDDLEILIATEAGGEGRNMQFCDILINYDLPWSPLKIEQRIGRIHRFGQKNDVQIYNFSTSGTVAERIIEVLTHKLKLFEESLGESDVMLGQIEDELNLSKLLMEVTSGKKKKSEMMEEIDKRIHAAKKNYAKIEELTLANKMDFNYDEYYKITLREREFSNSRIENFVNQLRRYNNEVDKYIGNKHARNNLYPVKMPGFTKKTFGTFSSTIALNNENLEFLAFGHPLVEKFISICHNDDFGGLVGIKNLKFGKSFYGLQFNFIVTFQSISISKELIPVIVDVDNKLDENDLIKAEKFSIEEIFSFVEDVDKYKFEVFYIKKNAEILFEKAVARIRKKVNDRLVDLSENMDLSIYPEMEKIKKSHTLRIKELEEKLELQKSKMKWYGNDMKGAITRTQNQINKVNLDMHALLKKYESYSGIQSEISLLNVAIVIGK